MKKVQTIDAFRGIQKRFVSFLSIVIIVLIGAGAYLLTSSISEGLKKTGDEYYHNLNYMDLQMISSLGINEQQIKELEKADEVEAVEGIIQLDGKVGVTKDMSNVTLLTTTKKINLPEMIEGRIPLNNKECAIPLDFALIKNLKVNDMVKISSSFNNKIALVNSDVKIVGIYNHPNYIRKNAVYAILIDRSLLNEELFNNIYNRVYITQKQNDINAFSDSYFDHQKQLKDDLYSMKPFLEKSSIKFAQELGNKKIDKVEEEAYVQINDAQKQIDDSKAKLEKELSSALAKINSGQAELDAAYNQLVSSQAQVESGEALLREKEAEYNATTARLKKYNITAEDLIAFSQNVLVILNDLDAFMDNPIFDGEFTREYAQLLIDKLKSLIDYIEDNIEGRIISIIEEVFPSAAKMAKEYLDNLTAYARNLIAYLEENMDDFIDGANEKFRALFEEVRFNLRYMIRTFNQLIKYANEYLAAPEQIEQGWQRIAEAKWQISEGWKKYEEGKNRLSSAKTEYAIAKRENEAKIADAQKQLDDKKKEVDDQIAEARKQLENLKCNWVITDRRAELTYNDLKSNSRTVANAGKIFGILFALVGGLVCFSTLIIIIEEERKLVGTSKAFGFRNNEILSKYLCFGILSTLLGCILAAIMGTVGTTFMQKMIGDTGVYNFGAAATVIEPKKIIILTVLAVVSSVVVTIGACTGLLRSPASVLMKGQVLENKKTRHIFKDNQKGSLYSRLIIRNMINDKARVIVSIIIVAGSVLVIGMGFCMRDSFDGMLRSQPEMVDLYDYRVELGLGVKDEDKAMIEKIFKENGVDFVSARYEGTLYLHNNNLEGLNILVCDENIDGFVNIADPKTRKKISLPEKGALFQNRMVENDNSKIGDIYTVYDNTLQQHNVEYVGQFNNYVGRMIIMSRSAYEDAFNRKAVDNCYYIKLNGADFDLIKNSIDGVNFDLSYFLADSMTLKFKPMLTMYNVVVILMISFAIIMSFMILTNLANIFINRKKKELIVMRINGYSISKTRNYLMKETVITTATGLVLGAVLGALTLSPIVGFLQQPDTQFLKTFNPKAWVLAILIETVFAVIVYGITFKKIEKLDFREIT